MPTIAANFLFLGRARRPKRIRIAFAIWKRCWRWRAIRQPDTRRTTAAPEDAGGIRFRTGAADPAARIRELAEGGYIDRSEPVVLIGECGTGNRPLATGLCLAAFRQKRRVLFTTAAALVNELVDTKPAEVICRAHP